MRTRLLRYYAFASLRWSGIAFCMLTLVAWAAARFRCIGYEGDWYLIELKTNCVYLNYGEYSGFNPWGLTLEPPRYDPDSNVPWTTRPKRWFAPTRRRVFLPYWFLLAVAAPLTALAFRYGPAKPKKPGHCQHCGYDLTGNESGKCPECGTPRVEHSIAARSTERTTPAP